MVVECVGIKFPIRVLQVLLAQSASAEVRHRYEGLGNVFETIIINRDFQQDFLKSYCKANFDFFNTIKNHIPSDCRRVLDVGCGIGLIDMFIYREFGRHKPKLYLYDKSIELNHLNSVDIAPTGFNEKYVFTASLDLTKQFLSLNGVDEEDIQLCEVGKWEIREAEPIDLVISRKSWGFHYPINEYLDDIVHSLSPTGVVITDVRNGQGAVEDMRLKLGDARFLKEDKKSNLVIARLLRN